MKFFARSIVSFVLSVFVATATLAEVTIATISKEMGKEGGGFSVNTGGSGEWTASTEADWITITRASGTAGVSCVCVVAANFSADTRTAIIDIAGNSFTVHQTGYEATISPTTATADFEGGSGIIEVTTEAGVSWSAKPNVDWLSVEPANGISIGSVTYTISPYTSGTTPRTGTLTVAGKTFSVTQTGTDVILTPAFQELPSIVGTFEVTVAALVETTWSVTPNDSWISVVDSGRGYGNDTLIVAVGGNPSVLPRTGTVSIGSKTLTVTQRGMPEPSLSITPAEAAASPIGAYGNVAVYSTPDAPWTAESLDSWITVSDGATGAGNGNTKYVVTANPTLEERSGQILFRQVTAEPDNEVEAGRLLYIPDTVDIATGKRTTSCPLTTNFDGTFAATLIGDPIPQLDKNDCSFSFRFRVGELGAVNRLITFFGNHAVYSDSDDVLLFDGHQTDCLVDGEWQRLTFCQDENGHVRLYDGISLVAEYDGEIIHDFTAGTTDLATAFLLGSTETPSKGYLKDGQFADLVFWGRALTEREVIQLAEGEEGREAMPKGIPEGMAYRHFRCSQNGFFSVSTNQAWMNPNDEGITVTGWSEFPGRSGVRQRAIRSDGTGIIEIPKLQAIFSGNYVLNNGIEFSYEEGHYGRKDGACYPYPVTWTGASNGTYNCWIYVEVLPKTSFSVFKRIRVGQTTDAGKQLVNTLSEANQSFGINLNADGRIVVEQNGVETLFTGGTMPLGEWKMLTVVGMAEKTITVYLDGEEIGNAPSSLAFGYFPPTDTRSYSGWFGYQGAVIDTVQCLTIGGWDGAIDEITFIDEALTSAQVKVLYDATKPVEVVHTVTQGVIEPTVTPEEASFEAAGGDGSAQVTVAGNTQWTAESGASWISVLGPMNHVGSATISYAVAANPATTERTGTLTLAGKTVAIEQEGLWSQLTYDGTVFGETSGSGFISVQVEGDGTWTASSDSSWLTLLNTGGHGSAEVMFVVDDFNTAVASRTAVVTIAGKTVEITQRGYELSIDPAVGEVGSNAGAGEIGITAPIDAVWEAIVSADWITLVGGNMGVGSGTLRYTVADNTTGETRTGKIIISGQEYTVTQHPYLKLTTTVDGSGTVSGAGDYETNERVTLKAVPAEGYVFTHWSGDAVGVEPEVTIVMDMAKTVTAHFIPEDAAERLAEEKAAQGGFYTREQLKALAMGDTVIEVDGESGTVDLAVQLLETADLVGGEWGGVDVEEGGGSVNVDAEGKVHIRVAPKGNTAFYRLVNVNAGDE